MSRVVLFNKPFGVLSQFLAEGKRRGLKDFVPLSGVYAAGRLDADSEGLLVLTDDGPLQHRITDPRAKMEKVYWAQVEGEPSDTALHRLASGVDLEDFTTLPCQVALVAEPRSLWPRVPPIRVRRHIPTAWLEVREGPHNRVIFGWQMRRDDRSSKFGRFSSRFRLESGAFLSDFATADALLPGGNIERERR